MRGRVKWAAVWMLSAFMLFVCFPVTMSAEETESGRESKQEVSVRESEREVFGKETEREVSGPAAVEKEAKEPDREQGDMQESRADKPDKAEEETYPAGPVQSRPKGEEREDMQEGRPEDRDKAEEAGGESGAGAAGKAEKAVQEPTGAGPDVAKGENRGAEPGQHQPMGDAGERGDVFQVLLPVDTSHAFDFIMDPQQLITKTEAAAYGGSLFEEGATLFFRRSDGKSETEYSSYSDEVRIINAGTSAVNVSLSAYVSPESVEGIFLTDDPDFTDDRDPSLYLALTDGENIVPVDSEHGACMDIWMDGSRDGEVNMCSFRLTGAVNRDGDWSEAAGIAPEITVTWTVTADEQATPADERILPDDGDWKADNEAAEDTDAARNMGVTESGSGAEPVPAESDGVNLAGENVTGSEAAEESANPAKRESEWESADSGADSTENIDAEGGENQPVSSGEMVGESQSGSSGEVVGESQSGSSGETVKENQSESFRETVEENQSKSSGEKTGEDLSESSDEKDGDNLSKFTNIEVNESLKEGEWAKEEEKLPEGESMPEDR